MAVNCGMNNPRKWIIPQIFLQELTIDQLNRNIFHRCTQTMGQFESKLCPQDDHQKVIVETIPLQDMSHSDNFELFAKSDFSPLEDSWPSYDIPLDENNNNVSLENQHFLKREKEDEYRLQHSMSNKRSRDDDCNLVYREFPMKRFKKPTFIVKGKEMQAFFSLLGDPFIHDFLSADGCKRISDKYLLAMVFAYFKRATFKIKEFNRMNFFIGLYLANDMEEDEEDYKYEIFPWALGKKWKSRYMSFLQKRDELWAKMGHKAIVSRKCCEEIMAIESGHWCWQRERPEHHAGALRSHAKDEDDDNYPRGPDATPRMCKLCDSLEEFDSGNGSSGVSWYLSSSSDSSPEHQNPTKCMRLVSSRFDMKDLKVLLKGNDDVHTHGEE